jgi:7-keto-8-aminopelargonate synthetase-like enzyme
MDGDMAPLPDLLTLSNEHNAMLMLDDAHGTGVLGPNGQGTHEHFGIPASHIDILMTSGSKALGAYGGYIAGSQNLISLLRNRSAAYIYTTALPPDACAATHKALDIVSQQGDLRQKLWHNIRAISTGLQNLGFDLMKSQTQIIPILIGEDSKTVAISQYLYDQGIYLYGIRPPTVTEGQSRLRLSVMATHTNGDIDQLLNAMATVRQKFF